MPVTRLVNLPGFSIDQVAQAAGNDPDVLRLENLDTDLPPPKRAVEATKAAIGLDENNSYLPFTGQLPLRELIAEKINRQITAAPNQSQVTNHQSPFTAANIVITCGGTEAMFDALLAMTDPGDEVILTDPTYAGMIYRVQLAGAMPRFVPFFQADGEWRLDLDAFKKAITRNTKVIFLMNPSMPTGAVLNQQEWQTIARLCRDYDLWLLYNAAMERILFDDRQLIHPLALEGMPERTVVVGSASKEFRMIGWRTGWVAAPRSLADDIAKVHIYNAVTPTGIAQAGVAEALKAPQSDFEKCLKTWQERRDMVCEQLKDYDM
ncbi:MAG: pyridoxal phosphate-dependent aminotransferase, partial [Bacteroidota bacterium]